MAERAGEGRLAHHVAGHAHARGVKAGLQRDAAAFGLGAHGGDGEVLGQHLAAAFVHHAGGSADFGVAVLRHVFLHKVHKARLALQQAQQLQGGGGRGVFDAALDDLFHHFFHGHFHPHFDDFFHWHFHAHLFGGRVGGQGLARAQAVYIGGQAAVAQDGEEAADGNGHAAEKGGWGR